MNNITILEDYLSGIADAIRYRGNTTAPIKASSFKTAIRNLPVNIIYNVPTNEETGKPDEIIQVMNYYTPQFVSFQNYDGDKLNLEGLRTNNIILMNQMFQNCRYLLNLDVRNFNTEKATNMAHMFSICSNLTSLNLSNFNGANVTDIQNMFSSCYNVTTLNWSNFNACNLPNFPFHKSNDQQNDGILDGCSKLVTLDASGFNGHRIQYLGAGFKGRSQLATLNLSGFNGRSIQTLYNAFQGDTNLSSLNMHGFNGYSVANLASTFNGCTKLPSVDFLNNEISTYLVDNISNCFYNCRSLTSFNYSNVNFANVVNASYAFSDCVQLQDINLSYFTFDKLTNGVAMFSDCTDLRTLDFSCFNTNHMGANINLRSIFSGCSNLQTIKWNYNLNNVTNFQFAFSGCRKLTDVIDFSNQDLGALGFNQALMEGIISNCTELLGLNFANCNGSRFSQLYMNLSNSLDSVKFWKDHNSSQPFSPNGSSFLNMHNFNGCNISRIEGAFARGRMGHLDLSDFNAAKVKTIAGICQDADGLVSANFNNFGANLTSNNALYRAFYNCHNLTELKLCNMNSINSYNLSETFSNTASLKTINYTGTTFDNAYNLNYTFYNCGLDTIDLNMLNFYNNACYFNRTFAYSKAKTINFGSQIPNMRLAGTITALFSGSELESFNMSDFANCNYVTSFDSLFSRSNIQSVDFTGYTPPANAQLVWASTFRECPHLTTINFGGLDLSNGASFSNTYYMFDNTTSIKHVSGLYNLNYDFGLFRSQKLTEKSVMNIIDNAIDQTQYNRTRILYVGANTNNSISESNRAYAESIGWRILA